MTITLCCRQDRQLAISFDKDLLGTAFQFVERWRPAPHAELTPKGLPVIIHRSQQPKLKRAILDRIGFGGLDSLCR
jgi:hypothetical protein